MASKLGPNPDGRERPNIVIPTTGKSDLSDFFDKWKDHFAGCHVIFVLDQPKGAKDVAKFFFDLLKFPFTVEIHDWETIKEDLGDDEWIIPRRTSAIRSYGYYRAWVNGALFVVTLDDDTRPRYDDGNHIKDFYNVLFNKTVTTDPRFYSTMKNFVPRGTPTATVKVGVAHGLWCEKPDLCAAEQLKNCKQYSDINTEEFNQGIIPEGALFSMCGMNLAFRTELVPQMYFTMQGKRMMSDGTLKDVGIDRCDDIWAGFRVKKYCDENGYVIHTGEPYVDHERQSNVWKSLEVEKLAPLMTEEAITIYWYRTKLKETEMYDYWKMEYEAELKWKELFT